ncbi:MAG: DUF4910 domain-containing protein [Candidatus Bathyarchaeia archaeon]
MYKSILKKIKGEVSGVNSKRYVRDISEFHRIQATPGFHDAAEYCVGKLGEAELEGVEVLRYPYDGEKRYLGQNSFQEWHIESAELRITQLEEEAKLLCNFRDVPISVIQRSITTPRGGIEAELVLVEDGTEEEHYKDKDVEGKIVLTSATYGDRIDTVRRLAVEEHGALGIITDGMPSSPVRHPMDLADARNYTSWWWTGKEEKCFGFVLSPKLGADLRQLVKETEDKGEKVKVRAEIEASFHDGFLENVTALIPGEEHPDEEVLIVAHLCHPCPGANDNASGCGAAIEVARVLKKLISEGELPEPKRNMRVLLVPEMAGSYAFLATQKSDYKAVAGVNLDMVGEDQAQTKGPLVITKTPDSLPSYTNVVLRRIVEETVNQFPGHPRSGKQPTINWTVNEFTGGSDHYIFSDPSVGIPMQMVGHSPDVFYHTSADTIDKVSESELEKVATFTATHAYFLANAGPREASWISNETAKYAKDRIINQVHNIVSELSELESEKEIISKFGELEDFLDYLTEVEISTIKSINSIIHDEGDEELQYKINLLESEINELAERELKAARRLVENKIGEIPPKEKPDLTELEREAASITPVRNLKAPLDRRFLKAIMSDEDHQKYQKILEENRDLTFTFTLALFWMDGERDLLDIARKVHLQTGFSYAVEPILEYIRLLKKYDLVQW